jgi:regulator of sigma E protease
MTLKIERPGVPDPFLVSADPQKSRLGLRRIGAGPPLSTKLDETVPVFKHSPADRAGGFQKGDRIVEISGRQISAYQDIVAALAENVDRPIRVKVTRKLAADATPGQESAGSATLEVAPAPLAHMGIVVEMLPIFAVQAESPAARADVQPGDQILEINGELPGDPLTLAERLRPLRNQLVELKLRREGVREIITKEIRLRTPEWYETSSSQGSAIGVPELGIAFHAGNKVEGVLPGSQAEKAGLRKGDELVSATLVISNADEKEEFEKLGSLYPVKLDEDYHNWASLIDDLQSVPPSTSVQLEFRRGDEDELRTADIAPMHLDGFFYPKRGFIFRPETDVRVADSWAEMVRLGGRELWDSVTMVVRFLQKLVSGDLSTRHLGGPGTILVAAGNNAREGLSQLLIFLTMLSANLAVVNFLPIPVLDGGHMVFLVYEGIRGKPASERMMVGLSYLGLALILGLMIYVTGLDFQRLFTWLGWLAPE